MGASFVPVRVIDARNDGLRGISDIAFVGDWITVSTGLSSSLYSYNTLANTSAYITGDVKVPNHKIAYHPVVQEDGTKTLVASLGEFGPGNIELYDLSSGWESTPRDSGTLKAE